MYKLLINISALALIIAPLHAQTATPHYPDIAGDYICTDHCNPNGGIAKIGQDGGLLTLINERNSGTTGYFETDTTIRAKTGPGWSDVRAVINWPEIHWENGTIWRFWRQ